MEKLCCFNIKRGFVLFLRVKCKRTFALIYSSYGLMNFATLEDGRYLLMSCFVYVFVLFHWFLLWNVFIYKARKAFWWNFPLSEFVRTIRI